MFSLLFNNLGSGFLEYKFSVCLMSFFFFFISLLGSEIKLSDKLINYMLYMHLGSIPGITKK